MRSSFSKYTLLGICLIFSGKSFSQLDQTVDEINRFLIDATFYADKYITPATDASVYQASSSWMTSPKKRKLWAVTLSVHGNAFFVPNRDRSFAIKNADFSFFTIQNENLEPINSAVVPSALGNDDKYYLVGSIGGSEVKIQSPKGVNDAVVFYPYVQGSIALWDGLELLGKYSSKVKLKRGDYQVYGFGLKHNFSHYVNAFNQHRINMAAMLTYAKENISFDFIDTQTAYGNLGINRITGLVSTWQFQISTSKQWNKWELMLSSITNKSDFKYQLTGERGQIEDFIPVQYILNEKLKEIYKTKFNSITEVSGRYQISKIYVQTSIAFGKFVNSNLAVQYEF